VSTIVIGPGSVNLSARAVWARANRTSAACTGPVRRSGHRRHLGPVAVGPDADRHPPREVHALDPLEEAVDEVLARLLAVGDDVDPRVLLLLEGDEHRVALGLHERRALERPRRPQRRGLREPGGLRQASGDRREEH
jgi:hypothetical protein